MNFSVILVEPEIAANVGFVARTMACYEIADLRMVGGVSATAQEARKTGASALEVLAGARSFMDLGGALADLNLALGFTSRPRDAGQRILDLPEAVRLIKDPATGSQARIGLVFGRESRGLSREDTLAVTHLVRIPTPQDRMSLNLSHAVAIALHALTEAARTEGEKPGPPPHAATVGEGEAALESLMEALERRGFLRGGKTQAHRDYLRILWQRLQPDRRELDFLTGLLRSLTDSPVTR